MSYNSGSNRACNFKSASRFALVRFWNYSHDYSLNYTPLSPISITYQLMLQSWYQKTPQSLVNMLVLFSWHNRLPYQCYNPLKTPLISALSTYISKSRIRCNSWQILNKFCAWGSEPPEIFENLRLLLTTGTELFNNNCLCYRFHRIFFLTTKTWQQEYISMCFFAVFFDYCFSDYQCSHHCFKLNHTF